MKRILSLAAALALGVLLGLLTTDAQAQGRGQEFGKGVGLHQYGPFDEDGDGIPNGLDPDYVKPKDGSGNQFGKGKMRDGKRPGFGPGDGTGNQGIGPRDGSGYGPGSGNGTGECDGTGPKGKSVRRGRR